MKHYFPIKVMIAVFATLFIGMSAFGHSYSVVELLGPDQDRTFLLVKDNHELASANLNLEELGVIKKKLHELNQNKQHTLVLTESMWMYGRKFNKAEVKEAIAYTHEFATKAQKRSMTVDINTFQKARDTVAYLDLPLPSEIANLRQNNYIRGESVDPRLPLLKLTYLLENRHAAKFTLREIFNMVDVAKQQIEELYEMAKRCDYYELDRPFFDIVEELSIEMKQFELLFSKVINRDDKRLDIVLTKKNVKKMLRTDEITSLFKYVRLIPTNLRAHAWAQDIATLHRILSPNLPEVVILDLGGIHGDLIEKALLAMGCTEKARTGISTEEVMKITNNRGALLSQGYVPIDKSLHSLLIKGIENSLQRLEIDSSIDDGVVSDVSEEVSGEQPKKVVNNVSAPQTLPPLAAAHYCNGPCCDKVAPLTCGRCKNVHYCSQDCQFKHWQIHKHTCSPK